MLTVLLPRISERSEDELEALRPGSKVHSDTSLTLALRDDIESNVSILKKPRLPWNSHL